MKKLISFFTASILIFYFGAMKAQITLDTSFTNNLGIGLGFKLVQISKSETKWYFADTLTNTFSLYNMDFTPFITNIAVPEPFAATTQGMKVLYVTRTLFDCDSSNLEYAYYSPTNPRKPFRVARTDGTILLQVDSANGPYSYGSTLGGTDVIKPIVNTSGGTKLILQTGVSGLEYLIYSLCDSLPMNVFDFENISQSFVQVYPNPAFGLLNFKINLPGNISDFKLLILDNNGRIVKQEKLNGQSTWHSVDTSDLIGGSYYYSLCSKDKAYQSGKFLLTK